MAKIEHTMAALLGRVNTTGLKDYRKTHPEITDLDPLAVLVNNARSTLFDFSRETFW